MTSQVQQVFIGSMPYAVHDPHPAIQHVSCFERQDLWEEACKEVTEDTMCLDVVLAQAEIHYNDEQSCNSAQWVIMIPWGIRNHSLLTYWKNKQHSIWARAARVPARSFSTVFSLFQMSAAMPEYMCWLCNCSKGETQIEQIMQLGMRLWTAPILVATSWSAQYRY